MKRVMPRGVGRAAVSMLFCTALFAATTSAWADPTGPGEPAPAPPPAQRSVASPSAAPAIAPGPTPSSRSNQGTDFWFAFGGNYSPGPNIVYLSGPTATSATVAVPGIGFSTNVTITPNQTTSVTVPVADVSVADGQQSLGVHVTSAAPIAVYGLEDRNASTDGFTALPINGIGTDYYVLGWDSTPDIAPSEFEVVATKDSTVVTITPTAPAGSRAAGVPYTVSLNTGAVYQLKGTNTKDLTGTHVSSNLPVAVSAGSFCGNVPSSSTRYCNYISEELTPTSEWGSTFLALPYATRTKGDTYRVLASQPTTVAINGASVASLAAGAFYQTQIATPSIITTSAPALVAQYSDSEEFDGITNSDPSESLVVPSDQFLSSYTVATAPDGRFTNYLNVVAPTSESATLRLDGSPISATFLPIGSTGFSGAKVPVAIGTHTIAGPLPFGLTSYGFGNADAYSYPGGFAAKQITTLSATPAVLGLASLQLYLFTLNATLTTGSGPVSSAPVTFSAGGTNVCTATTNAAGVASCAVLTNASSVLAVALANGYTAAYAGDAQYLPSTASAALVS